MIKSKRAVKPFRKVLRAKLRSGLATLRVIGEKKAWYLCVQVGTTLHVYSARCNTLKAAVSRGVVKFGTEPTRFKAVA